MNTERISLLFPGFSPDFKNRFILSASSVFILGLIAHAYKFFNLLPNYDSLGSLYSDQNTIHLGRCFLTLGCGISSYYDLSWVIGLLSLVYIALSSVCVQELLGITTKAGLILSSGLLVTFPAVTNTFAFLFTADGYFLAMLLSSLAVLLAVRLKKGFLPAAVCLCLSLGMYQAYFLYAMVLTLLYGIKCLLFDDEQLRAVTVRLGKVLLAGILGGILYLICNQLLLHLEHAALSGYNGMSGISLHTLPSVTDAVYDSLHDFVFFFFYSERGITFYILLNILFAAALLLLSLKFLWKKRRHLGAAGIVFICISAALLPLCIYLYYFVSSVNYHTIMLESIALLYVFLLLFPEHMEKSERSDAHAAGRIIKKSAGYFAGRGIMILSAFIIYNFILTANIAYTNMAHSFERSTALINRMAARMEVQAGFENAEKLAVIGYLPGSRETIYNYPPDLSGTVPLYVMRIQENYVDMLRNYNNIYLEEAGDDELAWLISTPEYQTMECWPAENSIQIIDSYVVIKLSEPERNDSEVSL